MQPVAILSALFCIVCNLSMFDCAIVGDHMVEAYSSMGRVIALYVVTRVSFCWPQLVYVRFLSMFSVLFAFSSVLLMCVVYVCCVSKVTPKILFVFCVVSGVLLICSGSCVLCSFGSGVDSDSCVFVGFM